MTEDIAAYGVSWRPGPDDERWLRQAIALSRSGMERGLGGPFGAVVVRGGEVLGEGSNRVLMDRDPTAHAEVVAIRLACAAQGDFSLAGATLYSSCEPCPMCLAAAFWARVERVVFAATRDDAAAAGFDDAAFYRELESPPASRRLPLLQALRDEALPSLAAWTVKSDKQPY